MSSLDNLCIVGVRSNPKLEFTDLEKGITQYSINYWRAHQPSEPQVIPVPYRGGYIGGFNHVTAQDHYLLVADGKGILAIDLADPAKGYAEFNGVDEVSEYMCNTSDDLVSCLNNSIQIRSLANITGALHQSSFSNENVEVPYKEIQHQGRGETVLSMIPVENDDHEIILLNDADDKTYLIEPRSGHTRKVEVLSESRFPHAFQRREQYHAIPQGRGTYTVFTESTSDDRHPNRVYSFDIRGPPTIEELEPLELPGRQILSMLPSNKNLLTLLTNYGDHSHLETLDPSSRRILNSKPLSRRYNLGDRLQNVGDALLIVRHLQNEVVVAGSEEYIKLTGAENDVPIPEISSTWEVPQYLYVTRYPPNDKKEKNKDIEI